MTGTIMLGRSVEVVGHVDRRTEVGRKVDAVAEAALARV
jgi:hypothetical protein